MASSDRMDIQQHRRTGEQLSMHFRKDRDIPCEANPGARPGTCTQTGELPLANASPATTTTFPSPDLPSYFLTISNQEAGQCEPTSVVC